MSRGEAFAQVCSSCQTTCQLEDDLPLKNILANASPLLNGYLPFRYLTLARISSVFAFMFFTASCAVFFLVNAAVRLTWMASTEICG